MPNRDQTDEVVAELKKIARRYAAIRGFCQEQIEHDARQYASPAVPGIGLTDRGWACQSILNIMDGKIDDQLKDGPDDAN